MSRCRQHLARLLRPSANASAVLLSCSRLTALALGTEHEEYHEQEDADTGGDERMAALVQAVPHLRALQLSYYHTTNTATDAGAAMHGPTNLRCTVLKAVHSSCPVNGVQRMLR